MSNYNMDYKKHLISNKIAKKKQIQGCTDLEILELEKATGVSFPGYYRQFLKEVGKKAGSFLVGSDFFYNDLFNLKEAAIELLVESGFKIKLPEDAFVFWFHQGYQFYFFHTDSGGDASVYYYCEGDIEFTKQWENFQMFFRNMVTRTVKVRQSKS